GSMGSGAPFRLDHDYNSVPEGFRAATTGMTTSPDMPLVLYVEDEEDNFVIAQLRLRGRFRVLRAATDEEACDMVRRHGPELRAVLMDLQLRGAELDGNQLVKLFRGQPLLLNRPLPAFARNLPRLNA